MGGPGSHVDSTTDTRTNAPAANGPANAAQPVGVGTARVTALLGNGAQPQEIADVLLLYPDEQNAIAHLLQTTAGNTFTTGVFDLVDAQHMDADVVKTKAPPPHISPDRYVSGNFGADPANTDYLKTTKVVQGGASVDSIKTTTFEAHALNSLRADSRRFEPDYMLALQKGLGVANASGAFNTETLRALLQTPTLAAVKDLVDDKAAAQAVSLILGNKGNWLSQPKADMKPIAAPPFKETGTAWGPSHGKMSTNVSADPNTKRADRVAHVLGHDSYAGYKSSVLQEATFLGQTLNGSNSDAKAHPAVIARLGVAERWVQQRHPGKEGKALRDAVGWQNGGVAAYGDTVEEVGKNLGKPDGYAVGVHMHSFGLAIDIDPGHNPYVFGDPSYWNKNMEMHLRRAAQMFGGEALTAKQLDIWSDTLSTEELYAKVEKVSASLTQYLDLPNQVTLAPELTEPKADRKAKAEQHKSADKAKEDALAQKFLAIGYTPEEAKVAGFDLMDFASSNHAGRDNPIWQAVGREKANKLTTHSQDLVVALRDVAGFAWGGTEMSGTENGDFMHFDLRKTSYGATVLAAAENAASHDMTDAKATEELAAAEAAKHAPPDAAPGNAPASAP